MRTSLRMVLVVSVSCLAACVRTPKTTAEMQNEFYSEFNIKPAGDVYDYLCEVSQPADVLSTWFSFQCDESVWEQILKSGTYETKRLADGYTGKVWESDFTSQNAYTPRWWHEPPRSDSIHWRAWTDDRGGHTIYFWRDPVTKRVYSKSLDWR